MYWKNTFLCFAVILNILHLTTSQIEFTDIEDHRIVGGFDAADGQFPYQISLRWHGRHICGGSILNQHYILTAAHCIHRQVPENLTVVTGSNNLDEGGNTYKIEKLIAHQGYVPQTITNDIALIKLAEEVKYGDKVEAIKLPEKDTGCNIELTLSGWGTTTYPGQIPNKLQTIKLFSVSNVKCTLDHPRAVILPTNICTLNKEGEGACHGDSGGPLVYEDYQVGVVSWGIPCAKGKPDVFTRVYSYRKWIEENMA
ncbi:polyserase-related [Holotrichia oblita]|uniref:Polyserase-related n=2 Tax=Holotrichia oblita TaxID=644536 RepID=A0ACB9TWB6_HOLOL|nr:polyserase-related [Holotrichia oblita]KAI4471116.1 polyserase-related [Holotrichia oblita]